VSIALPSNLVSLKNSLDSTTPVLVGIRIDMEGLVSPIRIVNNEVDIDWTDPDTGLVETWVAFPFEIDDMGEPARGELPQVVLKVSNVTRAVQGYVDQADGGVDAVVRLHAFTPAETSTYISLRFIVAGTSCDENWVTFSLSSFNMWRQTTPKNKCLKNNCSYQFKGVHCGYGGVELTCNRTLARCRELGNQNRFGGFPSIGYTGVKI
jgi:phage-related protein